eukprot:2293487-Pyramimonas_sp.AAC.1
MRSINDAEAAIRRFRLARLAPRTRGRGRIWIICQGGFGGGQDRRVAPPCERVVHEVCLRRQVGSAFPDPT